MKEKDCSLPPVFAPGRQLPFDAAEAACEARTAAGLIAINAETAKYGLSLSAEQARELAEIRTAELRDIGRVEFGESAVISIARQFAASPYVNRNNWAATLGELTGIFFRLKSATFDRMGDAELIEIMRAAFDESAHGSTELLEGRELATLAWRVRSGYSADIDEFEDAPDDDYDEGYDDGFTAKRIIM